MESFRHLRICEYLLSISEKAVKSYSRNVIGNSYYEVCEFLLLQWKNDKEMMKSIHITGIRSGIIPPFMNVCLFG